MTDMDECTLLCSKMPMVGNPDTEAGTKRGYLKNACRMERGKGLKWICG